MPRLKGMDQVNANLRREIARIKDRSMKGLINAAIVIRRDMDETPPLIPVDTGNLRASWFTAPVYKLGNPSLIIGFSANYAVFVHENVGANFQRPIRVGGKLRKRRPGAGPKFLERALIRNHRRILEEIRKHASIKK